jgi:cytochrome c biogenesis protein CcmG, thiol:disulfide interchange protein DsbE
MRRWLSFAPLIVLAALAILFAGFALTHNPHYTPAAMVGQAMPRETLAPLAGGAPTPLAAAAPPGTLVNFFASWCGPCHEEEPTLMALKAEGVRIVGVAYKDEPGQTRTLLAQQGDPYATVLVDRDGRAALDFGVSGVPETFLIGKGGQIIAKSALPLTPDSAEALLQKAGG